MMSINAVLMKFFQLPPAVRMILALAGFGSLASLFFAFKRYFTTAFGWKLALIILGIGIALFLVVWGIRRMFFRKKSASLGAALESQGPTRGDIAEQEQIISQKFREKLKALKESGLNVYQMPWFVLVGEPGCGKTASLIHSGLDFPLGRDEVPGFGGTRNYNWWFTSEAVVLDTAGRIAFHEEGTTDRVEWEHFLRLIKQHRPRCPVNGVVIALPANKLLQDTAEERVEKASILRDRLRQIHQLLGVRFPTFLLVTKTDLVGGFSEFFEEMRVDLAQRNQMVGWSRPGEFHSQYDPETFDATFDSVQERMRAWALRYLFQRRTTSEDTGMIVTYPEAMRDLKKPLGDYVKTIFQKSPLLEPPFFRGFYFTSAVQEGAPIFDILTRTRPGHVSTEVRRPKVEDSKPFFIHDFYARKVFPEQGLVFRSAKHVTLNKRLRRFVWAGSATLLVIMLTFWGLGYFATRTIVDGPKDGSAKATSLVKEPGTGAAEVSFPDRLQVARDLRGKVDEFNDGWARLRARMLFIGASLSGPQSNLRTVHAGYVARGILRPVLDQVAAKLVTQDPAALSPEQLAQHTRALEAYARWYGHIVGAKHDSGSLTDIGGRAATDVENWLQYLGGVDAETQKGIREELTAAFAYFANGGPLELSRVVAVGGAGFDAEAATNTLVAAIDQLRKYAENRYARIPADVVDDPALAWWLELLKRLGVAESRYTLLLAQRDALTGAAPADAIDRIRLLAAPLPDVPADSEPDAGAKESFRFAWSELSTFLADRKMQPIDPESGNLIRVTSLIDRLRGSWDGLFKPIRDGLAAGEPSEASTPQSRVYAALKSADSALVKAYEESFVARIRAANLPDQLNREDILETDPYKPLFTLGVEELNPGKKQQYLALAADALGSDSILARYLDDLRLMLGGADPSVDALRSNLRAWPGLLRSMQQPGEKIAAWVRDVAGADERDRTQTILTSSRLSKQPLWRPVDLFNLQDQLWRVRQGEARARLLGLMQQAAELAARDAKHPGVGSMLGGFDESFLAREFRRNRFNAEPAEAPGPTTTSEAVQPAEPRETRLAELLGGGEQNPPPDKPKEETAPAPAVPPTPAVDPGALLARYYGRDWLLASIRATGDARTAIRECESASTSPDVQRAARSADEALGRAFEAYAYDYLSTWNGIYEDPTRLLNQQVLEMIESCARASSWPEFQQRIANTDAGVRDHSTAVRELVINAAYVTSEALFASAAEEQQFAPEIEHLRAVFTTLGRDGDNVSETLGATRRPPAERGNPAEIYAARIASAWKRYVAAATSPDSTQHATALEKLRQEIVYEDVTTLDMNFIRPLVDVAAYGAALQAGSLATQLQQIFSVQGYPVGVGSQSRGQAPVAQFLSMLERAREFKSKNPDFVAKNAAESFAQCERWSQLAAREVSVYVNYFEPKKFADPPSNVYKTLEVSIPVTGGGGRSFEFEIQSGGAVTPDEYGTGVAASGKGGAWKLTGGAGAKFELSVKDGNQFSKDAGFADPLRAGSPGGATGESLLLPWILATHGAYKGQGDWVIEADFVATPTQGPDRTPRTYRCALVIRFGDDGTMPGGAESKGCIPLPAVAGGSSNVDLGRYLRRP